MGLAALGGVSGLSIRESSILMAARVAARDHAGRLVNSAVGRRCPSADRRGPGAPRIRAIDKYIAKLICSRKATRPQHSSGSLV